MQTIVLLLCLFLSAVTLAPPATESLLQQEENASKNVQLPPAFYIGGRTGDYIYRGQSIPLDQIGNAYNFLILGSHQTDLTPAERLQRISTMSLSELADHQIMTGQIDVMNQRENRPRLTLSTTYDLELAASPTYAKETLNPFFRRNARPGSPPTSIPLIAQIETSPDIPILTLGRHMGFDNGEAGLILAPPREKIVWYYPSRGPHDRQTVYYRVNNLEKFQQAMQAFADDPKSMDDDNFKNFRSQTLDNLVKSKVLSSEPNLLELSKLSRATSGLINVLSMGAHDRSIGVSATRSSLLEFRIALEEITKKGLHRDPRILSYLTWVMLSSRYNLNQMRSLERYQELNELVRPMVAELRVTTRKIRQQLKPNNDRWLQLCLALIGSFAPKRLSN